ncbi:transcription factor RFX3-like isoform X3 [Acanthaster planci]|uniref:Transcription factor RFX3-like isoform X3 n=1 Tax=Acanthaster planci TaxID=133434 RepID=A0A8B7ZW20_ACAPL|nr:transcription factor RFX3-like isoform X3 [Acanthaster planci]
MQAISATTQQQQISTPTIITTHQAQHQPSTQTIQAQQFVQVAAPVTEPVKDVPSAGTTVTLQTIPVSQTSQQGIYQGHVQANYPYSEATTMYTQATPAGGATYYSSGQALTSSALGSIQTLGGSNMSVGGTTIIGGNLLGGPQLITQQGGTYLLQGHTMDGNGHPLTHTTRASPATVQWLLDNYECAEGVSLPRSTLFNHYMRHCQEHKIDPVNAASFGKLIRSVFLGLRTRRLGTRGNSKYHYYGIRIKSSSPLNQYQEESGHTAMRQQPINSAKRFKPSPIGSKQDGTEGGGAVSGSGGGAQDPVQTQTQQHQQFLGDASMALPDFGELKFGTTPLPEGVTQDDVKAFQALYREHCEAILDVVVNLQFALIEALWQTFWRNPPADAQQNEGDVEKRLPKAKLISLCQSSPVQEYVKHYDHVLYQGLVEVLIPDVLRPIPSALTQAIRNFAKSLETWLKNSMTGIPQDMISLKVGAVTAFAQTLRRYTSLNHLAQAARAVLQNTSQINQMLSDLNRVDFANVQEQASWVCQCDDQMVQRLEQDFKSTLQEQNSLEQWAAWLEGVVTEVLEPHENSPNFAKAARQFLLKWSFYSSMVIRDLTLRSAASFGSFHLIRLLYDEFMFYLIEHRVAAATGETPIAVMDKVDSSTELSMNNSLPTSNSVNNTTSNTNTIIVNIPTTSAVNSVVKVNSK